VKKREAEVKQKGSSFIGIIPEREEKKQSERCNFCSKLIFINDMIDILNCKHKFHRNCIKAQISKTSKCPEFTCRYILSKDEIHEINPPSPSVFHFYMTFL
jgi:hypothetical protein